ncbi:hypothetical protein GGI35DRAFT_282190 [Trichoderma velutinum]
MIGLPCFDRGLLPCMRFCGQTMQCRIQVRVTRPQSMAYMYRFVAKTGSWSWGESGMWVCTKPSLKLCEEKKETTTLMQRGGASRNRPTKRPVYYICFEATTDESSHFCKSHKNHVFVGRKEARVWFGAVLVARTCTWYRGKGKRAAIGSYWFTPEVAPVEEPDVVLMPVIGQQQGATSPSGKGLDGTASSSSLSSLSAVAASASASEKRMRKRQCHPQTFVRRY